MSNIHPHMFRNDMIGICGEVLRNMIVGEVDDCNAYSLLADAITYIEREIQFTNE